MTHISDEDKLRCAERELKMRQKVYRRWVKIGRMTAASAAHEIACMAAIVEDYRNACGHGPLFGYPPVSA